MPEYPWKPLTIKPICCVPHPLLKSKNLSLHYGDKAAFENVCIEISKGCITALVGPSGCGKTSFLTCLNKLYELIPNTKISGELSFENENLLDPKINGQNLRRRIGMIFQKPNPFALSIFKNLSLPLAEIGIKKKNEQMHHIERVLKEVGLWNEVHDRLHLPALALSGGQQQRLCIARALTLKPEVLLMDEPCSALDPISSGVVEDLISSLRGQYTVLVVTHNLPQARRIADYVAFFWVQEGSGRLIEYGSANEIFREPKDQLTKAYLSGSRG